DANPVRGPRGTVREGGGATGYDRVGQCPWVSAISVNDVEPPRIKEVKVHAIVSIAIGGAAFIGRGCGNLSLQCRKREAFAVGRPTGSIHQCIAPRQRSGRDVYLLTALSSDHGYPGGFVREKRDLSPIRRPRRPPGSTRYQKT